MKIFFLLTIAFFIYDFINAQKDTLTGQKSHRIYINTNPNSYNMEVKGRLSRDEKDVIKEMVSLNMEALKHKDNKDSAWINDFDGHIVWDSRLNSKDGKAILIRDSVANNYYILDTTHSIITAFNESKNIIWQTNPHNDNSLPEYRHKNPKIIYFKIAKLRWNYDEKYKKGKKVIFINFSNSQFGFLDLKTGKFTYQGQD